MLCAIAKLDDEATGRLDALRRAASPAGGPVRHLYGHITLASFLGADEEELLRACRARLGSERAFSLHYEKLEVLHETSILVASPGPSETLRALRGRLVEGFRERLDPWTAEARWRPHTTLLFGPGLDLDRICRRLSRDFAPFPARVQRVELSRVLAEGYEILARFELRGGADEEVRR